MVRVPAIEVSHHGHRGIANFCFTRQLGLGHIGHADHVTTPLTVKPGFSQGGELRPFHHQVGAVSDHRQLQAARSSFKVIA
jgi:hypothetical protein